MTLAIERPNFFAATRAAFSYFSTLPVGSMQAPAAGALLALPLVGAVIGLLAGGIGYAATFGFPQPIPALFAFAVLIIASGAIHLDGFFDSCDALFAAVPPAERREIFKDPRRGSFALAGAAVIVPLWIAAIVALPPQNWWLTLAFAGALGRFGSIVNGARVPYAAGGSASAAFRLPLRWLALAAWAVVLSAAAYFTMQPAISVVFLVAGIGLLLGEWARVRLDGVLVGDVYGALAVILEVIALIAFVALR